ncbi:ABC transporter ATP-binding protein [Fibrella sp. HMF5335]|uniref:ABC transporter ATP-binding protein n=1 Tax=Fibrella rubiginis TaxID=2817060 RepID=A0A939GAJ7_9BACT|nr:ABC transporter ATP-binding protein [Fibrella rubiginis]MBO0935329.1 ABC transporter ATP-binding protein [Fibrella rubiginis]
MIIKADQIGKKYRREWIFRGVDLTLSAGNSYTFVGPNGSGKSTLLQVLAGMQPASAGKLTYNLPDGQLLDDEDWYRHIVLAAPYLELIEELTLSELLYFHVQFKPFRPGLDATTLMDRMQLSHARNKEIRFFSSGMKQRVKLGLALFSEARLVLLDEPTANLDRQGATWYRNAVEELLTRPDCLLLLGSNQPDEYDFCSNVLDVTQWK